MTEEELELRKEYYSRVRRTKFFLRYMPRRANLSRYPILKWFAASARKRAYLWSFRPQAVIPAFYAGWILALLPLIGFQIAIGFLLALAFRANLMILVGLQMVTNPLTIAPIWWANYEVGNYLVQVFSDVPPPVLDTNLIEQSAELGLVETVRGVLRSVGEGNFQEMARGVIHFFTSLSVGAVILGTLLGFISTSTYRFFGRGKGGILNRLRELVHIRQKKNTPSDANAEPSPEDSDSNLKKPDSDRDKNN